MQDDLDALKRSVDMIALLTNYGVTLAKKGNEYHGLCIWHDEKKPSMQVYVDKKDGSVVHCGYVIGQHWLTAYRPVEIPQ